MTYLFFLMLVGMILELMGVGVIIPAISYLTNEGVQNSNNAALIKHNGFIDSLSNISVVTGVLIIITIYFLKSIFLSFMTWRQTKFAFEVQANLSYRIFSIYLQQPYNFHLQRNSAQLIRNAINEVNQFTFSIILPMLTLLTEVIVLLGLLLLLIVIEPVGTLVVISVIGISSFLFYYVTKIRIMVWGAKRQFNEGKRIQHIQQGLGSIKDVILMKKEEFFVEQFSIHNIKAAKMGEFQKTLTQMPRIWLEFIAVSGVLLLVLWLVSSGANNAKIITILGFFAVAAFRMLPSVTRILASMQTIRYGMPIIQLLTEELKMQESSGLLPLTSPVIFSEIISLKNISYSYPGVEHIVLSNISLNISRGQAIGIIGVSGSGKSTLIDLILGLLAPDSGEINIDKYNINQNLDNWQMQIGYVPQTIYLNDDTLRRNIAFGLKDEFIEDSKMEKAIVDSQLKDFVDSLPDGLETKVGERGVRLSGGQVQRIGIARALYNKPSILILDEATSSLDAENEEEVMKAIRDMKGDKTMIIVTHRLSTIEHCDYIYKIKGGEIIQEGAPETIL